MQSNKQSLEKAKNYCFLLLKFRLRSENELYGRLKKKKFDDAVIADALRFMKQKGFIDDEVFARSWIECRIKRSIGLRRIRRELDLKGIDKSIIDGQLSAAEGSYCEEDIVGDIAKYRLSKLKGIDPQKAKRRLYAYLLRRGFSPDVVMDALNDLCRQIS